MAYVYGTRSRGVTKTGIIDREFKKNIQVSPDYVVVTVLTEMPQLVEDMTKEERQQVMKGLRGLCFSRRAVIAKRALAENKEEVEAECELA